MSEKFTAKKILTQDGSHTVISERFGVSYHSTHGAIQESLHVFLRAGLDHLIAREPTALRVMEMGFGTGLNALLTWLRLDEEPDLSIHYYGLEKFPLGLELTSGLNYPELLPEARSRLQALHATDWGTTVSLSETFSLHKRKDDFLEADFGCLVPFDLIYYDAFAPSSQPELWSPDAIERCRMLLRPGGTLVTYCAQGQYKRDLKAAGFEVEKLQGPPGKREMTRATKPLD